MGYRSAVGLMLYGKPEEVDMVVNMLQTKLDPNYDRDLFERSVTSSVTEFALLNGGVEKSSQTRKTVIWEFDDIKWYDSLDRYREEIFSWVDAITEEQEHSPDTLMLACDFVRVGEDSTDTEEHYSQYSDYRLQVIRRITIDGV